MFYLLLIAVIFAADTGIKGYIERKVAIYREKEYMDGRMVITRSHNGGAALERFKDNLDKLMLINKIIIGGAALILAVLLPVKGDFRLKLEKLALALVFAGGAQNYYDRMVKGSVTDYIRLPKAPGKIKKLIFNISDVAILAGGVIGCMAQILPSGRKCTKKNK